MNKHDTSENTDLLKMRTLCTAGKITWARHALTRMLQRDITREEVKAAVMQGRVIEEYPQDYPYPSCLILHVREKPLHVVCGAGDGQLWIITVYRPDPSQWETDFATRKESV